VAIPEIYSHVPFDPGGIMSSVAAQSISEIDPTVYKKRIWAWTMYDWANSAFATTILAAVLPVYFSQVAGSTLPSATLATSYWSIGLSVSLFLIAIISPILGTISDIARGKKRFLAVFAGIGIVSTALLVLVGTGDWVLASVLGIIGRIGFNGANTFYDSLLPHVAKKEDQDSVSARGYAMGYLGGGLLLAINIVMIQMLPGTWGPRLSFFSVAIWWAVFSIPLFRHIPEPRAATAILKQGETVVGASFKRLRETIGDIQHYKELFKYLISFLIYNDGIGTIIGVAAIYGAELGFGAVELVLALLLVQFVGIPYSLIFGRLPSAGEKRRPFYLAFVLFNMVALPLVGSLGARLLPANLSGARPAPYPATAGAVGEGNYSASAQAIQYHGAWQTTTIPGKQIGSSEDIPMMTAGEAQSGYELSYNGQNLLIAYSLGPDQGIWAVLLDGQPVLDPDTQKPLLIDAYNSTPRYDANDTVKASAPGEHLLQVINTDQRNPAGQGNLMNILSLTVLPPARQSDLKLVLGMILGLELVLLGLAFLAAPLFTRVAPLFDTKRSILLALCVYAIVAIWGYFLDSVVEFWFLAWMVAIVQGGSQALSRSLYAALSPAAKSGEFFGLFGIMEKFSAIIGPLLFAAAGIIFGSSRPAVLSLILLFFLGGFLLLRVNVEEGKRVAQMEDAEYLERETAI
jgi:UMF1 family MFS transporter